MKITKKEQLINNLKELGLNETDAIVYLESLMLGACSLKQLGEHLDIHRITLHDSVGRLIQKGLLLETRSGKRRLIYPQDTTSLQMIVDREQARVHQLQDNVQSTITMLQSLHLQSEHLPQVRISKGRQGIKDMLSEIRSNASTDIRVITDSRHFDELISVDFLDTLSKGKHSLSIVLPDGFEHFLFSAQAKGLVVHASPLRLLPDRKGGVTIRGDHVALHAYEGIFITTTTIQNAAIAHMMGSFFGSVHQHV